MAILNDLIEESKLKREEVQALHEVDKKHDTFYSILSMENTELYVTTFKEYLDAIDYKGNAYDRYIDPDAVEDIGALHKLRADFRQTKEYDNFLERAIDDTWGGDPVKTRESYGFAESLINGDTHSANYIHTYGGSRKKQKGL